MSTHLYLAPAGSGKTAYLVDRARQAAQDLGAAPRVVVPTRLQARAWRERLALSGGALGVRIGTFDDVYREILRAAGTVVIRLVDPVQVRLLRTVIDATPLVHYDRIRTTPGFVQALRDLIGELKAGGIFPEAFVDAVGAMDAGSRLTELARLYSAYQLRLQEEGWADYAGIGWLAAEALTERPAVAADWPCVMVDGFDDLTSVQLRVLKGLAPRVGRLVIALTGVSAGPTRPLVHKRFNRTRQRLETALGIRAEPLPVELHDEGVALPLRHLERTLYTGASARMPAEGCVTMAAVPDREAEVRSALRWIKTRIVRDGMRPGEMALLARSLEPYRASILQIAEEYGLPVQVADGRPLRTNPAIAALLNLLSLAAPGELHLAWRQTIEAWRSPYFDWEHAFAAQASETPDTEVPIGITLKEAQTLERVARWGSVIGGPAQWEEAFALLRQVGQSSESHEEEGPEIPDAVLTAAEAEALWGVFQRFCRRLAPPGGERPYRDWVAWVEELVGGTPSLDADDQPTSLGVAQRAEEGRPDLIVRDRAALDVLKDVLRGLVWAEEAVAGEPVTFEVFLSELVGAIDAAVYRPPLAPDEEAVLAAGVARARGISYRAVAVLGLAEGEFPTALSEDPFLRNADRVSLRDSFELPLDGSPESLEVQYFYEAITRPREAMLLTRPRIADNGAPWQPSPFWEEVEQRLEVPLTLTTSRSRPAPGEAASWPELLASVAADSEGHPAWAWTELRQPATCSRITHGQVILDRRTGGDGGAIDGDLTGWDAVFAERFHPHRSWSASRLEQYRTCPYLFFASSVLGLEPRQAPSEGLDSRQLGNIYHHILERLYETVGRDGDLQALLAELPAVAIQILDAAPRVEQFRETAWWQQTRQGILDHLVQSVTAIETLGGAFRFSEAERTFGIRDREGPALVVTDNDGDSFCVRGFIDRVDRDGAGHVRIVDYKTAAPYGFTNAAVRDGKKLQLPLYALAARDALGLGEVTEGFYWHVQHAKPSGFTLSGFRSGDQRGPQAALDLAVAMAWEAVRGARSGAFAPAVPDGGCPSYCPAGAFCWHFEGKTWG